MKKKTKANKQRLNNLLIVLLLSAMLLVMSTYAWFTANKTVNIDSIDVKVSTTSGLQISADGEEWKTVLDKTDLVNAKAGNYPDATNQLPQEMSPVSTIMEIDNNGRAKMFFGDVYADLSPDSATYGEYVLESDLLTSDADGKNLEKDGDEGKYIAFDVFLKSGNKAEELYMSGDVVELKKTIDANGDETFAPITTFNDESGIANATRIGVIVGGNTTETTGSAARALTTKSGKSIIWEPNADTHTANGVANGVSLGWISAADYSAGKNAPVIAYDGLYAETTTPLALSEVTEAKNGGVAKKVTIPSGWSTKKDDLISLQFPSTFKNADGNVLNNGITKMRIYMWVEGQDIDAENFASGTYVEYNLSFSLDPYTT